MKYSDALSKIMSIPMFQNIGLSAFVPTLEGSIKLNAIFENPYNSYPTIHIAGTNGKGSTTSMLTSVLMEAGYKVGCYTSPHLLDYRERVRINGVNVSTDIVCDFMDKLGDNIDLYSPSFFEVTTALAFYAFQRENVDVAIIETGLGGLTDSTNIITPILSIITNIGFDHKYLLGDTIAEIATQKGGIIKNGVSAIIGERGEESDSVFVKIAKDKETDITFAQDVISVVSVSADNRDISVCQNDTVHKYSLDLVGECQRKNMITALVAIQKLNDGNFFKISDDDIKRGLSNVVENTSLQGRWQKIEDKPLIICDTGHNEHGVRYIANQLKNAVYDKLYIVIGFMEDKEVSEILELLPKDAYYLFARASNPRSMSGVDLRDRACALGFSGEAFNSVSDAYSVALKRANIDDMIFVGGSTFIVADLLETLTNISISNNITSK